MTNLKSPALKATRRPTQIAFSPYIYLYIDFSLSSRPYNPALSMRYTTYIRLLLLKYTGTTPWVGLYRQQKV